MGTLACVRNTATHEVCLTNHIPNFTVACWTEVRTKEQEHRLTKRSVLVIRQIISRQTSRSSRFFMPKEAVEELWWKGDTSFLQQSKRPFKNFIYIYILSGLKHHKHQPSAKYYPAYTKEIARVAIATEKRGNEQKRLNVVMKYPSQRTPTKNPIAMKNNL